MQITAIATALGLVAAVVAAPAPPTSHGDKPADWLYKAKQVTSWGMCCDGSDVPYDCVYADDSEPTCDNADFPDSYTCKWTEDRDSSTKKEQAGGIKCHFNNGPGADTTLSLESLLQTVGDTVGDIVGTIL